MPSPKQLLAFAETAEIMFIYGLPYSAEEKGRTGIGMMPLDAGDVGAALARVAFAYADNYGSLGIMDQVEALKAIQESFVRTLQNSAQVVRFFEKQPDEPEEDDFDVS